MQGGTEAPLLMTTLQKVRDDFDGAPSCPSGGARATGRPDSQAWLSKVQRSKLSEQSPGMLSVSPVHLDQRSHRFAPC